MTFLFSIIAENELSVNAQCQGVLFVHVAMQEVPYLCSISCALKACMCVCCVQCVVSQCICTCAIKIVLLCRDVVDKCVDTFVDLLFAYYVHKHVSRRITCKTNPFTGSVVFRGTIRNS